MAQNNEPWPIEMTNVLLEVNPQEALEQEYYGPYNLILNRVFTFEQHYLVSPQTHPNRREAVDYLIEFLLVINNRIVGGIEIKRESDLEESYTRQAAHRQVLDRFRSMHDSIRVPVLVIISAIGKFCRVYRYTPATRTSVPAITTHYGKEDWNIDLSTLQGRQQLNTVFNEIKTNAQNIQ